MSELFFLVAATNNATDNESLSYEIPLFFGLNIIRPWIGGKARAIISKTADNM